MYYSVDTWSSNRSYQSAGTAKVPEGYFSISLLANFGGAVSPDGKTLLILTSGFNLNLDKNGNYQPQDSSEYVFVYDISSRRFPVKRQVVLVPNAFGGLVWSPDGSRFYVAGGQDDNVHTYAQPNGLWFETGTPVNMGHAGDLMNKETFVGPTATVVDVVNGKVLAEFDLRPGRINPAQSGVPGGEFPVGVNLARGGL